jgi:hypothetical protein
MPGKGMVEEALARQTIAQLLSRAPPIPQPQRIPNHHHV